MTTVVTLRGEAATIDARCAAVAEMYAALAERARAGEISAAATSFVKVDGTIGTLWEATGQRYQAIGAAAVLLAQMTSAREV